MKFFKNMVILKFKGFDNKNDVEMWRQRDLLITRDQAVELAPDENFIADLIGLTAVQMKGWSWVLLRMCSRPGPTTCTA